MKPFEDNWWTPLCESSYTFILYRIKLLIVFGFSDKALTLFDSLPNSIRGTIEGVIILSFIDIRNNNLSQAISRIRNSVLRFPQHEEAQALACELAILSRSNEYAIPVIREAYSRFPANQAILRASVSIRFLQNLPADSLYLCLLERTFLSTNTLEADLHPNILAAYEKIGNSSWLILLLLTIQMILHKPWIFVKILRSFPLLCLQELNSI